MCPVGLVLRLYLVHPNVSYKILIFLLNNINILANPYLQVGQAVQANLVNLVGLVHQVYHLHLVFRVPQDDQIFQVDQVYLLSLLNLVSLLLQVDQLHLENPLLLDVQDYLYHPHVLAIIQIYLLV